MTRVATPPLPLLPLLRLAVALLAFTPPPAVVASAAPPPPPPPGVCDIYARGDTPCVAAHSMTRALYRDYGGKLFRVRSDATNQSITVGVVHPGGVADTRVAAEFCRGSKTCTVTLIFDQSPLGNHLGIETGFSYLRPPRNSRDSGVDLHASPNVTLQGAPVYAAVFDQRCDVHEGNCDFLIR